MQNKSKRDNTTVETKPSDKVTKFQPQKKATLAEHYSVLQNPIVIVDRINSFYEFHEFLGGGSFGTVRSATKIGGDETDYAVKSIKKITMEGDFETLQNELDVITKLDHPNILKLYSVYEDREYVHLVTELCDGGDLVDQLMEKTRFGEEETREIMRQVLGAINHMHSQNVVHRDLKPDNILVKNDPSTNNSYDLRVIDFGFADVFTDAPSFMCVGTPCYMAPEMITGGYHKSADLWSLGVVMYGLLSGNLPFPDLPDTDKTKQHVLRGRYHLRGPPWETVSAAAKNLVSRLLTYDPEKRITASEALQHIFFHELQMPTLSQATMSTNVQFTGTLVNLRNQKSKARLQVEATKIAMRFVTASNYSKLKEVFQMMDTDQEGSLDAEELQRAFEQAGMPVAGEEIKEIVSKFDYLKTGKINYTDFLAVTIDMKEMLSDQILYQTFLQFDQQGKGYISQEDMLRAFRSHCPDIDDTTILAMVKEVGITQPEKINFAEFSKIFRYDANKESVPFSANLDKVTASARRKRAKSFSESLNNSFALPPPTLGMPKSEHPNKRKWDDDDSFEL